MGLSKKALSIILDNAKKMEGKSYGSFIIEKLKGGFTYKYYFEILGVDNYAKDIAYTKLVLPSKAEIIISPLPKLQEALKQSNQVALMQYEFEEKRAEGSQFLYVFKVGTFFFDLPEKMALDLERTGVTIQKSR